MDRLNFSDSEQDATEAYMTVKLFYSQKDIHSVITKEKFLARKLINSCATRWNSTYKMLIRISKCRWLIMAILSDETITKRNDQYLDEGVETCRRYCSCS